MPDFKPIYKTTMTSSIVSQILKMVESEDLKPGDKMPPERKLCELFNVGRGTVREAIKVLETMNIIERRGKFVVISSNPKMYSFSSREISSSLENIQYIWEMRSIIEIGIAALAAERATDDDISLLHSLADQPFSSQTEYVEYNCAFHCAIAKATHNPALVQLYDSFRNLFFGADSVFHNQEISFSDGKNPMLKESVSEHEAIVCAIVDRDISKVTMLIRKHLHSVNEKSIYGLLFPEQKQ